MDSGVRGWNELGIVDTIYEEEELQDDDDGDDDDDDDEDSLSIVSSVSSHEFTPSPNPQFTSDEPRSLVRPPDPDVVIHVQNLSFRLHKEILIARSDFLKRLLNEFSEITLSPPLNITTETFSLVKDFCYGTYVDITPFNVSALRTAAELLQMTESDGPRGESLQQVTEAYFCRAVAVSKEYASIVLRSSLSLMPEAETTASLVSRCIEALSLMDEGEGDMSCFLDGFKKVKVEDFLLVLESTCQRLIESHDLLYRIIDLYLKEHGGKVTEDQKTRMCNYIDCNILSPRLLMHAVQNPRMPLRFVVQAMFIEQLNTRHSIISAADHHKHQRQDSITLGAILQRDAALRQVAQLEAVMTATNSRIHTLEKELSGMRKLLNESESRIDNAGGRSSSFRLSSENERKVERGQAGSVSSLSYRDVVRSKIRGNREFSSSEESSEGMMSVGAEKNFGKRFMSGLKSAFRLQSLVSLKKKGESRGRAKMEPDGERVDDKEDGNEDIVVIKKDQVFHRRSRSQV